VTNRVLDLEEAKRDPRTYVIIGAAMEVHRHLGPGFLEAVYQEALEIEFRLREIPFERQVALPIAYKGETLSASFRADFICFGDILVEIKGQARVGTVEEAQIINYLRATGLKVALLINFGEGSLYYKRYVR
jgi:GxxExxY protein